MLEDTEKSGATVDLDLPAEHLPMRELMVRRCGEPLAHGVRYESTHPSDIPCSKIATTAQKETYFSLILKMTYALAVLEILRNHSHKPCGRDSQNSTLTTLVRVLSESNALDTRFNSREPFLATMGPVTVRPWPITFLTRRVSAKNMKNPVRAGGISNFKTLLPPSAGNGNPCDNLFE